MKNRLSENNGVLIALTLLFIGIAMWVLNYLTPEMGDDLWYKFIFVSDEVDVTRPVGSFWDVLVSQYTHYYCVNGRSVVHVLAQLFTGVWGKSVFNFCNAIVFATFIYALTRLAARVSALNLLCVGIVAFMLLPAFGTMDLWMTGSINYLWTSAAVCLFLLLFNSLKNEPLQIKHCLLGLLCIFIGWMHEGYVVPLGASLGIYALIHWRTIYRRAIFPLIIGFAFGAALCMFAPGTLHRASTGYGISLWGVLMRINSGLAVCCQLKVFFALLCVAAGWVGFNRFKGRSLGLKSFYMENLVVCNALFFSFGVVFLSGFTVVRSAAGTELFSLILLLRIVAKMKIRWATLKIAICGCGAVLYGFVLFWSLQNDKDNRSLLAEIKNGTTDIVVFEERKIPAYIADYIIKMNRDYYSPYNNYIATLYHRDKISFMPRNIYEAIMSQSDEIKNIERQRDFTFYVIPLDVDDTENLHPVYILNPTDFTTLPFWLRPFAYKLDRYAATEIPIGERFFNIAEIDGGKYLFISRNKMIDNRVNDIVLR